MSAPTGYMLLHEAMRALDQPFSVEPASDAAVVEAVDLLGLPPALLGEFAQGGPVPRSELPWVVEEVAIYALRELVTAQEGYRWAGPARTRLESWPSNWIVMASISADPIFVDIDQAGLPVYYSRHGAGTWIQRSLAPTFQDFLAALIAFEGVLLHEFVQDIWIEEGLRPDFVAAVTTAVKQVLPSQESANFVDLLDG